jgi:hypothetical protein
MMGDPDRIIDSYLKENIQLKSSYERAMKKLNKYKKLAVDRLKYIQKLQKHLAYKFQQRKADLEK